MKPIKSRLGFYWMYCPKLPKKSALPCTAINLFVRDMPRLSVGIDLTYVEIAERKETLEGMSEVEFSYDDYEATRLQHIETVKASLSEEDKAFLLSLNRLTPDWSIYDYQGFPSVKWKLHNLEKFKSNKPEAYEQQLSKLESVLEQ